MNDPAVWVQVTQKVGPDTVTISLSANGMAIEVFSPNQDDFLRTTSWEALVEAAAPAAAWTISNMRPVIGSGTKKILAIKELRSAANMGLKDAKEAIDRCEANGTPLPITLGRDAIDRLAYLFMEANYDCDIIPCPPRKP